MTIEEALKELCSKTIDARNDWYPWGIDETSLPAGISLPGGNRYAKNVALKLALNKEWLVGDDVRKREIINYYIAIWGGISGNEATKITQYANSQPNDMISRGRTGVASWSKALCVYNPYEYAIFDSRVSASLNAMQILSRSPNPILFPILPSRNGTIIQANNIFTDMVNQGWSVRNDNVYYIEYLNLLKETRSKLNMLNVEIYTIEMLLFSKAEELVNKAFPENISGERSIGCNRILPPNDVNAHSNKANKNPMDRPAVWQEKTGPCPKCGYPEVVARKSQTTGELYFGCARPKQGIKKGCNFKGCRSH